jgi:hypothetical protein
MGGLRTFLRSRSLVASFPRTGSFARAIEFRSQRLLFQNLHSKRLTTPREFGGYPEPTIVTARLGDLPGALGNPRCMIAQLHGRSLIVELEVRNKSRGDRRLSAGEGRSRLSVAGRPLCG